MSYQFSTLTITALLGKLMNKSQPFVISATTTNKAMLHVLWVTSKHQGALTHEHKNTEESKFFNQYLIKFSEA